MRFAFCLVVTILPRGFAIWPAPREFEAGNTFLWLTNDFHVSYEGGNLLPGSAAAAFSSRSIVQGAILRAKKALFEHSFIPWKLVPRNDLPNFEPPFNSTVAYVRALAIIQGSNDNINTFKPIAGQVDESYTLNIEVNGTATIRAISSTGVLRALETFTQLFYRHSKGRGIYTNLAPVRIFDSPVFSHRGLNMDVSRNWFPVEHILRTIDALSWNKFNRLHIHMTDSQSWPLDIPSMPELSGKGAYSPGLSYTPADLQTIQVYAIERGIEVIVEFDMPGHTTSIGLSYPQLVTASNAKPWNTFCAEPPCGSLKLNSTDVDDFVDALFADVLPRINPYSAYFHTQVCLQLSYYIVRANPCRGISGGDEVNLNAYLLEETVRSNEIAILQPLLQKLVDRIHRHIRKAGLVPIVWEEMAIDWKLKLGQDVVVQAWLSDASVAQIATKGHKVLAGNYNFWYLDCGKGQWLNFDNGPSYERYYPFNDYCSPVKNWRLVYSYDPLAGVPTEYSHLVLGGEVHMWSEQTDPVNLDDMLWPRSSAAAEVLWSGRTDSSGRNRSQITAAPRLAEMRERMVSRGVRAGPVVMVFCTQHDAHECSL